MWINFLVVIPPQTGFRCSILVKFVRKIQESSSIKGLRERCLHLALVMVRVLFEDIQPVAEAENSVSRGIVLKFSMSQGD